MLSEFQAKPDRISIRSGFCFVCARCSTHFALLHARWCGAASRVEHGIDEFEDGALIGGWQLFDTLQTFQQARGFRRVHPRSA